MTNEEDPYADLDFDHNSDEEDLAELKYNLEKNIEKKQTNNRITDHIHKKQKTVTTTRESSDEEDQENREDDVPMNEEEEEPRNNQSRKWFEEQFYGGDDGDMNSDPGVNSPPPDSPVALIKPKKPKKNKAAKHQAQPSMSQQQKEQLQRDEQEEPAVMGIPHGGGFEQAVISEDNPHGDSGIILDSNGNPIKPGDESEFYPAVFYSHDYTQEDGDEEATDNPDYCFLCECSQLKSDFENDANFAKMIRYIFENYDKVEPKRFNHTIQVFYNVNLRDYFAAHSTVWRQFTINQHFYVHIANPRFILEDLLRGHRDVAWVVRDFRLLKQSKIDGRYIIDSKQYAIFCRATVQITNLCAKVKDFRMDNLY